MDKATACISYTTGDVRYTVEGEVQQYQAQDLINKLTSYIQQNAAMAMLRSGQASGSDRRGDG